MRILSTLSVGARERITLVEVHGQQILLGVTTQNISSLHSFSASEQEMQNEKLEQSTIGSDFSLKLQSLLRKGEALRVSGKDSIAPEASASEESAVDSEVLNSSLQNKEGK